MSFEDWEPRALPEEWAVKMWYELDGLWVAGRDDEIYPLKSRCEVQGAADFAAQASWRPWQRSAPVTWGAFYEAVFPDAPKGYKATGPVRIGPVGLQPLLAQLGDGTITTLADGSCPTVYWRPVHRLEPEPPEGWRCVDAADIPDAACYVFGLPADATVEHEADKPVPGSPHCTHVYKPIYSALLPDGRHVTHGVVYGREWVLLERSPAALKGKAWRNDPFLKHEVVEAREPVCPTAAQQGLPAAMSTNSAAEEAEAFSRRYGGSTGLELRAGEVTRFVTISDRWTGRERMIAYFHDGNRDAWAGQWTLARKTFGY